MIMMFLSGLDKMSEKGMKNKWKLMERYYSTIVGFLHDFYAV